jgi:hypothetical protein
MWRLFAEKAASTDLVFVTGNKAARFRLTSVRKRSNCRHDQNRAHHPLVFYAAPIGAAV